MKYVDYWVHVEKIPIPREKIIKEMESKGIKSDAVIYALRGLLRLGYLRRTVMAVDNKTSYVQLRRI
jgi:hypothetical protein